MEEDEHLSEPFSNNRGSPALDADMLDTLPTPDSDVQVAEMDDTTTSRRREIAEGKRKVSHTNNDSGACMDGPAPPPTDPEPWTLWLSLTRHGF